MQPASSLLMIRPASFAFNEQTAASNTFQNYSALQNVQQQALSEFDAFSKLLTDNGLIVHIIDDTAKPHKPDAIFPNNWISFHENGDVVLYPMQAENRRMERREDIIRLLENTYQVNHIIDLSRFELDNEFLEGTGSMVLDRENKLAYACLSPRTNMQVLQTFCEQYGYTPITFTGQDENSKAIYHTNVMMCIASRFAVICLDCINNQQQRKNIIDRLTQTHKDIISISLTQMKHFAGNMLEVSNKAGENILIMSASAHNCLTEAQIKNIEKYARILSADLNTIELVGGGSARCMLAEIFLPLKTEAS